MDYIQLFVLKGRRSGSHRHLTTRSPRLDPPPPQGAEEQRARSPSARAGSPGVLSGYCSFHMCVDSKVI